MKTKPGDIVQLRSGGPALTVLAEDGDKVRCIFFAEDESEFREVSLPSVALDLLDVDEEIEDQDEDVEEDEDDGKA